MTSDGLLREAVNLITCLEMDDEQGRWAPCPQSDFTGSTDWRHQALPKDQWCDACTFLARPEVSELVENLS